MKPQIESIITVIARSVATKQSQRLVSVLLVFAFTASIPCLADGGVWGQSLAPGSRFAKPAIDEAISLKLANLLGPAPVRELSEEEIARLRKKYGDKFERGDKIETPDFYKHTRHGVMVNITIGRSGQVIHEGRALQCNYLLLYDKAKKIAAVVHTNIDDMAEIALIVTRACNMMDIDLTDKNYVLKNVSAVILRYNGEGKPNDGRAVIYDLIAALSRNVESALRNACTDLSLPIFNTDTDISWIETPVRFLVDEGIFVSLRPLFYPRLHVYRAVDFCSAKVSSGDTILNSVVADQAQQALRRSP